MLLSLLVKKIIVDFFMDMFRFIENALNEGQSVLVHCLAGAHRAGTTGIATLMYFAGMGHFCLVSRVSHF